MDSGDDLNSLYSTEEEADDGKTYYIEDVLAEKEKNGKTVWLVSWEGYDSDYNMWLPKENFDDPLTLEEWKQRKKLINDGLLPEYDWRTWEKRQVELANRKAEEKALRHQKRELLRAERGAIKRKGKWYIPDSNRRGNDAKRYLSDDDYSDGDVSPTRPQKRVIVINSDSDDDVPLVTLNKSTSMPVGADSSSRNLSQTFALPIRSSQSPFPPERSTIGLQKPKENSLSAGVSSATVPQQPNGYTQTAGSRQSFTPQQPTVRKAAPPRQPPPRKLNTTVSDMPADQPEPLSASKPYPPPRKINVPRPRQTAKRPSISIAQNVFNIPKRVAEKKPRRKSMASEIESPVIKDFYTKASRHWNQPPRDRDTRQPDMNNMTLMQISTAAQNTSVPSSRHDRQPLAQEDVDTRQATEPGPEGSTLQPTAKSSQPFTERSSSEEPPLFVSDSQDIVMEDAPVPDAPGLSSTTAFSSRARQHPVPEEMPISMSIDEGSSKMFSGKATTCVRPSKATIAKNHTTVVHLNGAHNVPVGDLNSLDQYASKSPMKTGIPTFIMLRWKDKPDIHIQVTNFGTIEHHELLQAENRYPENRILTFDRECLLFTDFLKHYERKNEAMFFSQGQVEPNRKVSNSTSLLFRAMNNAAVFSGKYVSLLIWPAKDVVWHPVTLRFIDPKSQYGALMFLRARQSDPPPSLSNNSDLTSTKSSVASKETTQNSVGLSALGLQAINQVYIQPLTSDEKETALKEIFNRPEAFSMEMHSNQKQLLLEQFIKALPLANAISSPEQAHSDGDQVAQKAERNTTEDPRKRRRASISHSIPKNSSNSNQTVTSAPTRTSAENTNTPFSEFFKEFMDHAPYRKEKAIEIFKQKLGVDWEAMKRNNKEKIHTIIYYPAKTAEQELVMLQEFVHSLRVPFYDSKTPADWARFVEAMRPKPWYHDKSGQQQTGGSIDREEHVKATTGSDGLVLVHESASILDLPPLVKRVHNPHLRIFRLSLGESYLNQNAVNCTPRPSIKELLKDGEHVLLTDSAILKAPMEIIRILDWLAIKVASGDAIRWKIFARPQLTAWLSELISANAGRPKSSDVYREIYARVLKLTQDGEKTYRYDGEWLLQSTSAMESDVAIGGYDYNVGLDERSASDTSLEYNDRMLIKWFSSTTRSYLEKIRFISAVIEQSNEFGVGAATEWQYMHFYQTSKFVETFVKPTTIKARWRKERDEQHRKELTAMAEG